VVGSVVVGGLSNRVSLAVPLGGRFGGARC